MQKTGRDKGPENSRKERGSFTPDFQFPNSFSSVYFLPGDVREIFGLSTMPYSLFLFEPF